MKLLGRHISPVSSPTTTATRVSMKDARTITILAVGASNTTNITVSVAKDAAGTGEVTFDGAAGHGDGITDYWVQTGSTGLWARSTQAAAGTVPTTSGTGDITAIEIEATALPDQFTYIKASHANATLVLVTGSLMVQRRPSNLRSLIV